MIYGFSYEANLFVRLDCINLPNTNTLAYYKNPKSFITLGPGCNFIKLLRQYFTNARNKQECLFLANFSTLV